MTATSPAPADLADFYKAVEMGTFPVDHVASINGYEYEIFLNSAMSPPKAIAKITNDAMDRLFDTPDEGKGERFRDQADRVQEYLHKLTGQAIPPRSNKRLGPPTELIRDIRPDVTEQKDCPSS